MPDLKDGEFAEIKGSGSKPYVLRNVGGVYSCSCPAWRNQSIPIENRTCKHLGRLRGIAAEAQRIGEVQSGTGKVDQKALNSDAEGEESGKEPPLLLAHPWDHLTDLSGWWMSEKLDGVRAYWDGCRFLSRQGNEYRAPAWFIEGLPEIPLDGELWLDRQMFQRTVSIVRRHDASDHWKEITYVVFDAPALGLPFEERQRELVRILGKGLSPDSYVRVLEQAQCAGLDHLQSELDRVVKMGGEGLMLRQPRSQYDVGRSTTLYKVKTFLDAEARVVEQLPGEGKHAGRLGALLVEMPDGKRFSVGTGFSDAERERPPSIGSLITYRYQELTDRGVPRFPTFLRVRSDLNPATVTKKLSPKKTQPSGVVMTARRFELVDEKSSKFWEIRVEGDSTHTRYGRIGSNGQEQVKVFSDGEAAETAAEKLITEKLRGGYHEVNGGSSAPVAPARAAKPPAPKEKKAVVEAHSDGATKKLCISGKLPSGLRKHDYESALAAVGISLVDDVVAGLDYLVLADPQSTSSKAQKARQLGIPVLSEDEMKELITP